MIGKKKFRVAQFIQILALLPLAQAGFAAANFSITPVGTQPTTVTPGSTVTANYLLTNLTNTTRDGYFIRGLPSTVTLDSSGIGSCQSPITLSAHSSCTLVFNITGAVSSNFAVCKDNSCTTAASPLNVTSLAIGRKIAVGTYCNESSCLPLLAQSSQSGPWTYPSTIISNLPSSYDIADFKTGACVGSFCIAAGSDDVTGVAPFVAMSLTDGNNWTYPIGSSSTRPTDFSANGAFNGSACADSNWCVAVGHYLDSGNIGYPLIAQYLNGIWTYAIDKSTALPANNTFFADFSDASCSGNLCIAAGTYEDNSAFFVGLLAQSTDHGATWTYKIDDTNGAQPANVNTNSNTEFTTTSCSGSICVAAGDYLSTDDGTYGMLAITQDSGGTYTYAIDRTHGPAPANYNGNSRLLASSCSGNLCIASGFYNGTSNVQHNWLVKSIDGGTTWTNAIDSGTGPQPALFSNNGSLSAASCSGLICVVAGSYLELNDDVQPYLAQSTNGGITWTTMIDASTGPQLASLTSGTFNHATCVGNSCFAVGEYSTGSTQFPMLAQSNNGGAWTYVIDADGATLPSDFLDTGAFNGSSAGNALTAKLQKKTQKDHYQHNIWKKGQK